MNKQSEQKKISEAFLQSQCYQWFHNSYPNLRGLLCCNLNNSKNKIDGNRNKAMGVQPGRADFTFYYKGSAYFIELKLPGEKQSTHQIEWQNKLWIQGFDYFLIYSFDEFKETIIKIFAANDIKQKENKQHNG